MEGRSHGGWQGGAAANEPSLTLPQTPPLLPVLQEPGPGQFRFPHFYLIGFQKCATTSLYQ